MAFPPIRTALAVVLCCAATAFAQAPAPQADPADLGLRLPRGPLRAGGDRRVVVADGQEQPVVGKVFLEAGDVFAVKLPNGRLVTAPRDKATLTDRPFEPVSKNALIKQLAAKFPGFKTRSTNRYVYVYNTSDAFYQGTSRILETMHPALLAYCKRLKLDVEKPETPLVVVMFRTEAEFQKYRKMPSSVAAYYNTVNNYIVMYEQSELAEVAPAMAVKQSISTIAHEGVHQILHNIGVQNRLSFWPMWISEGLPEYFAPTEIGRRIRWSGVGKPNQLRLHALRELLKQPPPQLSDGGMVKFVVQAKTLTSDGYAVAWALTDYLAKMKRDSFIAHLREVSDLGPLQRPSSNVELFERHFGADYPGMQKELLLHLSKLPYIDPVANQPHFLATIDVGNRRHVMVTTSPSGVRKWQGEVLSSYPAAARAAARFNVRVFANKLLANQAAKTALGS